MKLRDNTEYIYYSLSIIFQKLQIIQVKKDRTINLYNRNGSEKQKLTLEFPGQTK